MEENKFEEKVMVSSVEEEILEETREEKKGEAGIERKWKTYLQLPALLAGYLVLLFILLCLETGGMSILNLKKMYVDFDVLFLMLLFLVLILAVSGTGGRYLRGWKIALGLGKDKGYSMTELRMDLEVIRFVRMTVFAVSGIIAMVNLVDLLYHLDNAATLGESIANAFLSFFYAFGLILFQLPIESRLRELLMGYMEDGVDEESVEDEQTLYFRLRGMGLTDREAEVARLVAKELSNKDIGKVLHISDGTVKKHITHILEKTRCNSRDSLVEMVNNKQS